MRAACRKQQSRRGFTLVEMLAVVAIIGILVGLITAAAIQAKLRVKITQIGVECKELEGACLGAYREKFGMMPTDFAGNGTIPRNEAIRQLKRVFPLCPAGNYPANTVLDALRPHNALTFWLGGVYDTQEKRFIGFSPNPRDPFSPLPREGRIGPFYDFKVEQVAGPFYEYISGNTRYKLGGRYHPIYASKANEIGAYVYFRAENGHYLYNNGTSNVTKHWLEHTDVKALQDGNLEDASGNRPWINPESCQIICGGLDGQMGTGTSFPDGTASGTFTAYDQYRWDDQSNFTKGTFEDARE